MLSKLFARLRFTVLLIKPINNTDHQYYPQPCIGLRVLLMNTDSDMFSLVLSRLSYAHTPYILTGSYL